jgi:serine/threonine protein kinase/formylglycine-generating enzyme required for sulfatase activity
MQLIGNRYQVEKELGQGAMGTVYLARDQNLGGRKVAVKVMSMRAAGMNVADSQHREQFTERFRREAISAAVLSHPNIVTIHDTGEEQGVPYIVMELVPGRDLRQILGERKLTVREKLRILRAVAAALDYAHSHKIIHRDVKPENIMMRGDGEVKLTDFGIAKNLEAGTMTVANLTEGRALLGTPQYMPAEVLDSQPWTPKGDQYSLAVVAFELLMGRVPFDATMLIPLLRQITMTPVPARESINPEFPVEPYEILVKALSKSAEQRFDCCVHFVEDLSEALRDLEAGEVVQEREERDWARVRETHDLAALRNFQSRYPTGRFASLAKQRAELLRQSEQSEWESLRQTRDAEVLRAFVARYPKGQYRTEANQRLELLDAEREAWSRVKDATDPFPLQQFLQVYPDGSYAEPARWRLDYLRTEAEAWQQAQGSSDERLLEGFLSSHPAGPHASEATSLLGMLRRESADWNQALQGGSIERLTSFLRQYPEGRYSEEARQRQQTLVAEMHRWRQVEASGGNRDALQGYLSEFPTGMFAGAATQQLDLIDREYRSWQAVSQQDAASLRKFLQAWPKGQFSEQARHFLDQVEGEDRAWADLQKSPTVAGMQSFLDRYPQSRHHDKAVKSLSELETQAREQAEWQAASQGWDPVAIERYLERWPKSKNKAAARSRIDRIKREQTAWDQLQNNPNLDGVRRFLREYPDGQFTAYAQALAGQLDAEESAWNSLRGASDLQRLESFFEQFPKGRYSTEAMGRIEQLRDEETLFEKLALSDDPEHCRSFLLQFPASRYSAQESSRLSELDDRAWTKPARSGLADDARAYLAKFADGRHQAEANELIGRVGREAGQWEAARSQRNEEMVRQFLRDFPMGVFVGEARALAAELEKERLVWGEVSGQTNPQLFENYARNYPASPFAEEARQKAEAIRGEEQLFAKLEKQKSPARCRAFLERYPEGLKRPVVAGWLQEMDAAAWARTKSTGNTQKLLESYLEEFPEGAHAVEARGMLEHLDAEKTAWEQAKAGGNEEKLWDFLARFPNTRHEFEAKTLIDDLQAEARRREDLAFENLRVSRSAQDFRQYLQANPSGRYRLQVEQLLTALDQEAWAATQQGKPGIDTYKAYLREFPDGQYAAPAQAAVSGMRRRKYIPIVIFAAVILTVILSANEIMRTLEARSARNAEMRKAEELKQKQEQERQEREKAGARAAEEQRWQDQGLERTVDIAALRAFVRDFSAGTRAGEAQKRIEYLEREEQQWKQVSASTDPKLIERFLEEFKDGRYLKEARNKQAQVAGEQVTYQKALASKAPKDIQAYLDAYGSGPHAAELKRLLGELSQAETTDWNRAKVSKDARQLQVFVDKYKDSKYVAEARVILRDLEAEREWAGVDKNSEAAIEEFLRRRLLSPSSDVARKRLAELRSIREKEELARRERERKEKEARDAKERADREAKEKSDREAKERADRDAKEKSDREAKERADRDAKEKLDRESKEKKEPVVAGPREVRGKDGLAYLWLPGGKFTQGCIQGDPKCQKDEPKAAEAQVGAFTIGKQEVTVGAYEAFLKGGKMPGDSGFNKDWQNKNYPMQNVTPNEAQAYCRSVGGRLPTEAEWEFAARGNKGAVLYPSGSSVSGNVGTNRLADVGQGSNGFGLQDLAGGIAEIVSATGGGYVVKGGSAFRGPEWARVSARFSVKPDQRENTHGFRCVF